MNIEETRRRSRGIQVFAITPFVEEGGRTLVDEEGVKRNVESWVQANVPVVVVCGGVGELWHLGPGGAPPGRSGRGGAGRGPNRGDRGRYR